MALAQMLFSLDENMILPLAELSSEEELELALQNYSALLDPGWLVIGRQVRTSNGKYLDLLCIDREENLVVVELKKALTPREVTAQVIEYASYIAKLSYAEANAIYQNYCEKYGAGAETLSEGYAVKFGVPFDEEQFKQNVKMVIVASKMDAGTEHIVRYLRDTYSVDINILFFQVFQHGDKRLLGRVWLEDELELEETTPAKWNGEYYVSFGTGAKEGRCWEDAVKYGFISAGGGSWYTRTLNLLHEGDRVWVNIPHTGYVGVGEVQGEAVRASEATFDAKPMNELALEGSYFGGSDENEEFVVPVKWLKTVSEKKAVKETGFFGNQNTVCRPQTFKWQSTVDRLKTLWNIK